MISIIDNPSLAETGRQRMRWFMEQMPLIASLKGNLSERTAFSWAEGGHLSPCRAQNCFLD